MIITQNLLFAVNVITRYDLIEYIIMVKNYLKL